MKVFFRTDLTDKIMMLAGTALTSLAYACFFIPEGLAPGGIGGLSVILSGFIPIKTGILTLLLNIPIFIFARRMLGREFVFRTFFMLAVASVLMDVLPSFRAPGNGLVCAIAGGLLMGTGLGTVLFAGASTGGTDTLALSLQKKYKASGSGNILLLLDCGVVSLSAVFGGAAKAVYSALAVLIQITAIKAVKKIYSKRIVSVT